MKLPINDLISHRFRGFAPYENTLEGFVAALDFGALNLEFDIRAARCGTPMIYHDAYAKDGKGVTRNLCDYMASEYAKLGGTFSHIPTAEALLEAAGSHSNQQANLLIDIKDAGFEVEILALVNLFRLQDRVVYVSWVPETLYVIHNMDPSAALCLSHWCQKPPKFVRDAHGVFEAKGGMLPDTGRRYIHGETSGWYSDGPLRGQMRDMLTYVCVPQEMVSEALVADYHLDNIKVSTFSYLDWEHINAHKNTMNIDLFFIDNRTVFDELRE